jgi:hypothetical protein
MERQQPSHFGAGFSAAEQFPLGRDLKARGEVGQIEGRGDRGTANLADLSVRKDGFRSVLHQGNKPKTATLFVVPTNTFPFAIVGATNLV